VAGGGVLDQMMTVLHSKVRQQVKKTKAEQQLIIDLVL